MSDSFKDACNLPNSLWLVPSVGGRERDLRAGAEEPQELPLPRPHLLQADDVIHQQLDAHQDHQAVRGSHASRTKVRIAILVPIQGCGMRIRIYLMRIRIQNFFLLRI